MDELIADGGVIRKVWIGEAENTANICSGSMPTAGEIVSAARSPTS